MSSPKILYINPVVRTTTSTGRIVRELADAARADGWEAYTAFSAGRDGHAPPGIQKPLPVGNRLDVALHGLATRIFDRHGLASASATRAFVRQLQQIAPDLVHIHNIHGYFLNYPILFDYLRRARVPVVWTVHDCWLFTGHCYHYDAAGCMRWQSGCHDCPQKHRFPASFIFDRSRRNFADKRREFLSLAPGQLTIATVSQWMSAQMRESFFSGCPIVTIHNGIDTSIFRPSPDSASVKTALGIGRKRMLLAAASIWSAQKGLSHLAHIACSMPADCALVMVGVDKKTARTLPPGIIALPSTSSPSDLARLYSAADVFLNPTLQDNYPTVNLEAIACGTPVVTFRTGGSVESITPLTGVVVGQGDSAAMLEAALKIDKNALSRACRRHALDNFAKDKTHKQYIDLYRKLIQL